MAPFTVAHEKYHLTAAMGSLMGFPLSLAEAALLGKEELHSQAFPHRVTWADDPTNLICPSLKWSNSALKNGHEHVQGILEKTLLCFSKETPRGSECCSVLGNLYTGKVALTLFCVQLSNQYLSDLSSFQYEKRPMRSCAGLFKSAGFTVQRESCPEPS